MARVPSGTESRLRRAAEAQPGCVCYENRRPIAVPAAAHGLPLLEMLCLRFPHAGRVEWAARCAAGRFLHPAGRTLAADDPLPAGMTITQVFPEYREPPVAADIRVVYEDDALLALDKPAPLPMHPSGRYNRNTLRHFLELAFPGGPPFHVHRLDANTSGLVVLVKKRGLCRAVQRQFEQNAVRRSYLARCLTAPEQDLFTVDAPIRSAPGRAGSHDSGPGADKPARTRFRVLRRLADGTALLLAQPVTGRTNQIRIHLWLAGHPLCGDPSYLPGGRLGTTQTLPPDAPPLCLLAWRLRLTHPVDGRPRNWTSLRKPAWLHDRPLDGSPVPGNADGRGC